MYMNMLCAHALVSCHILSFATPASLKLMQYHLVWAGDYIWERWPVGNPVVQYNSF